MAWSKWGSRAEEAMTREIPEPTLDEQITALATEAEIEETCRLVGEYVTKKTRSFVGCEVEVTYDAMLDWYHVSLMYRGEKLTHTVMAQVRSEDIIRECVSVERWAHFMNKTCVALRLNLTDIMKRGGEDMSSERSEWYEATGNRPARIPREIVYLPTDKKWAARMTWGVPAAGPSQEDENAAIESIKKAMGNAGTD